MKRHLILWSLLFTLGTQPLVRGESPAPTPPAGSESSEKIEWEWRDFQVSDIRDLQLNAGYGRITFTVGSTHYRIEPATSDDFKMMASSALLTEIRRATKILVNVRVSPSTGSEVEIFRHNFFLQYNPPQGGQ